MRRRELLTGTLKVAAASPFFARSMSVAAQQAVECSPCAAAAFPSVSSPAAKLRIKPIMTNMIHSGVWEGPCRFNVVSVAKEKENVQRSYEDWTNALRKGEYPFGKDTEILEPTLVTFNEDFTLPAAAFAELDRDARSADVFFIAPQGSSSAAFDLVHRFRKPGIVFGINCRTVDVAAYAKS